MKPALLVIDIQKQFFKDDPETERSLNGSVEYVNYVIPFFRAKNLPIVFIQHKDEDDGLVPGFEGFDLPDAFKPLPGDIRITKTYGNAFNGTGLTEKLKELGVDTVLLAGYCAEHCVLSTCRGAEDVDLNPIIIRGSLASGDSENIRFVEKVNNIISVGALKSMLAVLPD